MIDVAERRGIKLREALETSPYLRHTRMLNGERCPVDESVHRPAMLRRRNTCRD